MNQPVDLHNLLGVAAALSGAMSTGLLAALVSHTKTAEELAKDLSLDARTTRRVLDVLVAFDVAVREGERYGASPMLKGMAAVQPIGIDQMSMLWGHLPVALKTGKPFFEMDAAPQKREALYANVVQGLGRMFAPTASELATKVEGSPKRILDVGCGSGVWSLAIAARFPDARVTGLDLPDVLDAFKARATEMGLGGRIDTLPGDVHAVDVPEKTFDLVVVANVLRIEELEPARRILTKAAGAVAKGGSLLIVDAFSDGTTKGEQALRVYAMHLTLRTAKGRIYEASDVKSWMTEAGLLDARDVPLENRGPGAIGALVARRAT